MRRLSYSATVFHRFGPFNAISSYLDVNPIRRLFGFTLAIGALTWGWTLLNQGEYLPALVLVVLFTALAMLSLLGWEIRTVSVRGSRLIKSCMGITFLLIGVYSVAVIFHHKGDKAWSALLTSPTPTPTPFSMRELAKEIIKELPSPTPKGEPRFKEKVSEITISMGGNVMGIFPLDYFRTHSGTTTPAETVPIGSPCRDYNPITVRLRDEKILVSLKVWDESGLNAIEIVDNEFTVRPAGWDRNSNDDVVEIVDEKSNPVLQIHYATASEIVINGIFPCPDRVLHCSEEGGYRMLPKDEALKLKPLKKIFKYPSWKYRGQYAE